MKQNKGSQKAKKGIQYNTFLAPVQLSEARKLEPYEMQKHDKFPPTNSINLRKN